MILLAHCPGGSRAETQSILLHITKLNAAKAKLNVLDTRIAANRKELKSLQQMNKKFAAKAQKLEVEQHKLQILKERMGHSKLGHSSKIAKLIWKQSWSKLRLN